MTRTPTKPLNDRTMWRKARRPFHPDTGGDPEVFIWLTSVMESVCSLEAPAGEPPEEPRRKSRNEKDDKDRIPYPTGADFREVTLDAIRYANNHPDEYGRLLRLLEDCIPRYTGRLWREQERGASYRRLAAIGHLAGMNVAQRSRWYDIARSIPLSDRHAGHILARMKRSEAA